MSNESDKEYRSELRSLFKNRLKIPRISHQNYPNDYNTPGGTAQHFKDQSLRTTEKPPTYDIITKITERQRKHQMYLARSSGGDADRSLCDARWVSQYIGDSYCDRHGGNYCLNQYQYSSKEPTSTMPTNANNGSEKYYQPFTPMVMSIDGQGEDRIHYETGSNINDICVGSEGGSTKSQKSSKTVVSRRSSHELKKILTSQCKFQEEINETLKQMCNTDDLEENPSNVHTMLREKPILPLDSLPVTHCKHCTDKIHSSQSSHKDVTTEIGRSQLAEGDKYDTLTISVEDVVNSKVINPMIRKLQRMYLNNLKEEMSLMEDLEGLPHKVNEVYKAMIFKQKE